MARLIEMGEYEEPAIAIKAIALVQAGDRINQTDAHAEKDARVNNLTFNQLNVTPEAIYKLMDGMDQKTIDHKP